VFTRAVATAERTSEPDYEYAPMRIDSEVSRSAVASQLSLYAEFGGWELARVQRYEDGTRRVLLRRRRRTGRDAYDGLPLPGLMR
jgi:hypothetical protein